MVLLGKGSKESVETGLRTKEGRDALRREERCAIFNDRVQQMCILSRKSGISRLLQFASKRTKINHSY